MFVAWLAWHFLPDGWSMLNDWTGGWLAILWHVVSFPFVLVLSILRAIAAAVSWVVGAVDGAFRVVASVQAVLLPVWALLAGRLIGRNGVPEAAVLWLGAAGLNALCAVLLGYPVLAAIAVVGSLAAFAATLDFRYPLRGWAGWLAAGVVAGLMAWGWTRYGTAFMPVCWPLVPLSWCCLVLGTAYGVRSDKRGLPLDRGAARLLLLASAMALAVVGPFAVDAARAAGFLPGAAQLAPAQPAAAVAAHAPVARDPAGPALPTRLPGHASASRDGGKSGKPAGASPSTRPRT